MRNLLEAVERFNNERGWNLYHDPRSLALAICGEVGELAHLLRWKRRSGMVTTEIKSQVESEVADILIFVLALCVKMEIDPERAVKDKLATNAIRFPPRHV